MSPFLSSQTLVHLAMGVTAYIGLLHFWHAGGRRGPHLWAACWALASLGLQSGKLTQLSTRDPEVVVAAARLYAAMTPLMIGSLCAFVRSLGPQRTARARALAFAGANLGLSVLIVGTPWFLRDETSRRADFFAPPLLGATAGPALWILPAYVLAALAWSLREMRPSREFSASERNLLLSSFGVCAALGVSTALSVLRWIRIPSVAEYGPVVIAIALSYLLVQRHRRLEDELQTLVDVRTGELVASGASYRSVIDNAPIGVFVCDLTGQIVTANPRLAAIAGSPSLAALQAENALTTPGAVEAGISLVVARCLEHGEVISTEHKVTTPWGRTVEIRLVVAPRCDAAGRVAGVVGLVDDVTGRLALEAEARRAQRLESVRRLAAGVAHEINNPMAFVRTNLGLLREECQALRKDLEAADGDPGLAARLAACEEMIDDSREGVERTVAIVRDMGAFARSDADGHSAVDLNAIVESCVRMAGSRHGGATRIETRCGELPPVWGSTTQLHQLFVHLLENALQAAGGAGTVSIATGLEEDRAVVRISDDGPGIDAEIRDRLFDPFFTTKPAGERMGLGLYVSHEIVRAHGGAIVLDASPGQGASFAVHLSLARAPDAASTRSGS